jgi:hypothetical protein
VVLVGERRNLGAVSHIELFDCDPIILRCELAKLGRCGVSWHLLLGVAGGRHRFIEHEPI